MQVKRIYFDLIIGRYVYYKLNEFYFFEFLLFSFKMEVHSSILKPGNLHSCKNSRKNFTPFGV